MPPANAAVVAVSEPRRRRGKRSAFLSRSVCFPSAAASSLPQKFSPRLCSAELRRDCVDSTTSRKGLALRHAVSRFPWQRDAKERQARMFARNLELLPQERCMNEPAVWPVWASILNNLVSVMLADISSDFARASYRATEAGDGPFLAAPLSSSLGWRRRARLAGFLGSAPY